MTAHPETLDADDTTEHAAVLMIHGGFRTCRWWSRARSWASSRSAT